MRRKVMRCRIQHKPAAVQTSTDKIRAAIDRIRGKSLPKPESDDPNKLSRVCRHRSAAGCLAREI
jgi:hypothetical protein